MNPDNDFIKNARRITQKYIEEHGASFIDIDALDELIAIEIKEKYENGWEKGHKEGMRDSQFMD